jgi:GTP-binding protein
MAFDASFYSSAPTLKACPQWSRIEIALAGRSNVGKSSMLNALVGKRNLARISKTPGRTRMLNFFTSGGQLALVDLPGYGYARMPRNEASRIALLMRDYLTRRESLAGLVMLIDLRRGPRQEELELAAMMRQRHIEPIIAATKSDKVANSQRAEALRRFLPLGAAPLTCSVLSGEGVDRLRQLISDCARRCSEKAAQSDFSAGAT